MPKTKISEFDVDPANNTDINSINIAEGCAPSGINNAIRQLMSDLKEFQTGAGGDPFNGAVNGTVGATTPASGAFTTLSASGAFAANGGATLGDASGDALTINSSAVSIPNGLNFDSNTFVIDATNNRVGVGTASPSNKLQITNSSASNTFLQANNSLATSFYGVDAAGSAYYWNQNAYPLLFGTNDTERMRIDSSGTLCIGTTSNLSSAFKTNIENGRLGVSASSDPYALYLRYNTSTLGFYLGSPSADSLAFSNSAGTERMRIDSSGSLAIGLTDTDSTVKLRVLNTAGQAFSFNGSTGCGRFTNDDLNHYSVTFTSKAGTSATHYQLGFFNSGGNTVGSITHNNTNTTYGTSSDYRLKENIAPMTGALGVVGRLKPCTYTWKADGSNGQGFIAHELQEVVPDAVVGEKDAVNEDGSIKPQGIDTSYLVATLTAAIQEQQAIITDLKARIETLENK